MTYIIYKICCDQCDYKYIGYTKNFIQRRSYHKKNTTTENNKSENILYKTINLNGGWDNWRMVPLEICEENINTKLKAESKVEEWKQKLDNNISDKKNIELKIQHGDILEKDIPYIIYKIYSNDCDEFYIGSTHNFRQRKSKHKINANGNEKVKQRLKLYQTINEYGGWDNWNMVLLEICDKNIKTKTDARMREEEWRVKLNATLNSQRAYVSEEQKKEENKIKSKEWMSENYEYYKNYKKNYNNENPEKIKQQKAEEFQRNKETYNERRIKSLSENPDKVKQQKHEEYERNKDKYLERAKNYKEENEEKIKERRQEKIQCGCGVSFSRNDKARHCRSLKHQNWINKDKVNEFALIQFDINMNKIKEFDSPKQAADELNICHKKIGKCCRGAQKTVDGFIFKYIDNC